MKFHRIYRLLFCLLLIGLLMQISGTVSAQVDPNIKQRLQLAPIIVDHTSMPLFDQIPDQYVTRAENIRMMWGDRSVGDNINSALNCLQYASDEAAPANCKNSVHPVPQFNAPVSLFNWSRTGGYNRSRWVFYFDGGFGITPEIICPSGVSNGMYDGLTNCFDVFVRNNISLYDAFGYQHSYLTIDHGSTIASPSVGYMVNQANKYDVYDYEKLETDFPSKVFYYWTTSLSRELGSDEGTIYNNQMRNWSRTRKKILFDVADIESHSPVDRSSCYDNRDGVQYCSSSTTCENYPDDGKNNPAICQHYTSETNGGHLGGSSAGKIMLAKAYWILMAQIAGWNPGVNSTPIPVSPTPIHPTVSPTRSPTIAPSITVSPNSANLSLTLLLHGIGNGGDNVNASAIGNMNPLTRQRVFTIEVYNSNNQLSATRQGSVTFNSVSGTYLGVINLGILPQGVYTIRAKTQQFLRKLVPGIINLSGSTQTITISPFALVTGDSNDDNTLSILDYNMLLDCFSELSAPKNCADPAKKKMTDFTDDGDVNQYDYNLFLRELSVQSGQ